LIGGSVDVALRRKWKFRGERRKLSAERPRGSRYLVSAGLGRIRDNEAHRIAEWRLEQALHFKVNAFRAVKIEALRDFPNGFESGFGGALRLLMKGEIRITDRLRYCQAKRRRYLPPQREG
jgi:hypothetical protein